MPNEFAGVANRIGSGYPKDLPDGRTNFTAINSTDITSTTEQTIKAGTTGKKMYVNSAQAVNKTAAEETTIEIGYGATPTVLACIPCANVDDARVDQPIIFAQPIEIPAGEDIVARATSATGDTKVTIQRCVEA